MMIARVRAQVWVRVIDGDGDDGDSGDDRECDDKNKDDARESVDLK